MNTQLGRFLPLAAILAMVASLVVLLYLFVATLGELFSPPSQTASATVTPTADLAAYPLNPGFEDGMTGWSFGNGYPYFTITDEGYSVDIDHTTVFSGTGSAHIKFSGAKTPISSEEITTTVPVSTYRGKRVRYTAFVRTDAIATQAGISMEVPGIIDGKPTEPFFPISTGSTDGRTSDKKAVWHRDEIILDIPEEADRIVLGAYLNDRGQIWLDDVRLEVVGLDIPTTDFAGNKKMENFDFEQKLASWDKNTGYDGETEIGVGKAMAHTGSFGAYLQRTGTLPDNQTGLLEYAGMYGGYYLEKTVQISAYINADKAPNGARLWIRAMYFNSDYTKVFAAYASTDVAPPQTGKTGWQKVSVSLLIPDRTDKVSFGTGLNGDGEVWLDDVQLEVIPSP